MGGSVPGLSLSLSISLSLSLSLYLSPSLSLSLSLSLALARFVPVTVGVGSHAAHFFFLGHGANRTGIFRKKPCCGHIGVLCFVLCLDIFRISVF